MLNVEVNVVNVEIVIPHCIVKFTKKLQKVSNSKIIYFTEVFI